MRVHTTKALKYALGKGAVDYEDFLQSGDPEYAWKPPEDEWQINLGFIYCFFSYSAWDGNASGVLELFR